MFIRPNNTHFLQSVILFACLFVFARSSAQNVTLSPQFNYYTLQDVRSYAQGQLEVDLMDKSFRPTFGFSVGYSQIFETSELSLSLGIRQLKYRIDYYALYYGNTSTPVIRGYENKHTYLDAELNYAKTIGRIKIGGGLWGSYLLGFRNGIKYSRFFEPDGSHPAYMVELRTNNDRTLVEDFDVGIGGKLSFMITDKLSLDASGKIGFLDQIKDRSETKNTVQGVSLSITYTL